MVVLFDPVKLTVPFGGFFLLFYCSGFSGEVTQTR